MLRRKLGLSPETDTVMLNNNSAELREWAARCVDMASATTDAAEREILLRKCEALRALADSEDWLNGSSDQAAAPAAILATIPSDGASA